MRGLKITAMARRFFCRPASVLDFGQGRAYGCPVEITFSNKAGTEFYKQVQDAIAEGDTEPFFDFSKMPADWDVPPEQPKGLIDVSRQTA